MIRFLKLLLAGSAIFLTYLLVNAIVNEPAEGKVVVEEETTEEVVVVTETATVTIAETETATETTEDTPEVTEVEEEFIPLKWDGRNIKKFAKKNGGVIVTINGVKYVQIGDAYYFTKGKGKAYVRTKDGEVIKL